MKRLLWTIPALIVGSTAVLAGASSENRLDEKSLQGPGGEGAHSSDPNIDRSGSPGPAGPGDGQTKPASKFNDYGTDPATGTNPGATGADGNTGASGPDANTGAAQKPLNESNSPKSGEKPGDM
jgi:hypothetical protein